MSGETVEAIDRIKSAWAAFNQRDWDGIFTEFDPEVEYTPAEENAVYRGPEAITAYLQNWFEAWETCLADPEEIEITPDRRAFVSVRFRVRGKGSEVEVEDRLFWVGELRGGKLSRISEYADRREALEAAGLSE